MAFGLAGVASIATISKNNAFSTAGKWPPGKIDHLFPIIACFPDPESRFLGERQELIYQ